VHLIFFSYNKYAILARPRERAIVAICTRGELTVNYNMQFGRLRRRRRRCGGDAAAAWAFMSLKHPLLASNWLKLRSRPNRALDAAFKRIKHLFKPSLCLAKDAYLGFGHWVHLFRSLREEIVKAQSAA